MSARDEVIDRCGGHCEAMVMTKYEVWTRCGINGVEVHHALTRARGGALLDEVGETHHLIALCHQHHRAADGQEAYDGDLLIDGYVLRESDGRIVYYGTDPYLNAKYPL